MPWWHILFGATILLLAGIVTQTTPDSGGGRIGALVTLTAISIGYVILAKRASTDVRFGIAFTVLLVVGAGVAASFSPNMALFQAIAFPLIWMVLPGVWMAIVANVALAGSVGIGFVVGLGGTRSAWERGITIEAISLVGSVALGIWMTRIGQLSEERQLLLDKLTATQDRLTQLSRESGVISERERLAREIHDTIAQSLTGIVMLSQHAQRDIESHDLDALAERLKALETNAREALVETRSLVTAGAPAELGEGIASALERLVQRFTRDTGIPVRCDVGDLASNPGFLTRDSEVVLLRSAQESLANIRKHAAATEAALTVRIDGGAVVLCTSDNGTGFDPHLRSPGHGLAGMRDRIALAGGILELVSAPTMGTTLRVVLPQLSQELSPVTEQSSSVLVERPHVAARAHEGAPS